MLRARLWSHLLVAPLFQWFSHCWPWSLWLCAYMPEVSSNLARTTWCR